MTEEDAEAMNRTAAEYPPDVDEFEMSAIEKAPSIHVQPPRVAEAAAAMECVLHQALQLGTGPDGANLVIGRILCIHVRDDLINAAGDLMPEHLHTIGRLGGRAYSKTTDRFELQRRKDG